MNATATTTIAPAALREMAAYELKSLRRAYKRTTAWLTACAVYGAELAAGVEGATLPNIRLMPGKDHKHRMYASADRIHRLLGMPGDRPHTLDAIGQLITDADTILTKH